MTVLRDGWRARLWLRFERRGVRTRLSHRRHEGPLLVQRAFHPEGAACHVYLIHPPGGVVGGDRLELQVEVASAAHALLTTPAAGKFYRCGHDDPAQLSQHFEVAGCLEWLPQENILYPQADARLRTFVQLQGQARFIGMEVACLGLPARAQSFGDGIFSQAIELWRDGQPLLIERAFLGVEALRARWGLAARPVLGTLLATPAGAATLACVRARLEVLPAEPLLAATLVDGVLVVRGLAQRADQLRARFIELWRALRPQLLGCVAVPPRIWAM